MGLMVMTPKRRLRRSVFASLFKLIVCTSNVLTKLVLPPTLFPNSVGADTDRVWPDLLVYCPGRPERPELTSLHCSGGRLTPKRAVAHG